MYFIEKTIEFDKWFRKLNDLRAKAKILLRLQKLENEEHFGDYAAEDYAFCHFDRAGAVDAARDRSDLAAHPRQPIAAGAI